MFVNVDVLFPNNTDTWERVILTYLIIQATMYAVPDLRSKLFSYSFKERFPKILVWMIITSAILAVFGGFMISFDYMKGVTMTGIGLTVLLIHGFYVSVIEELMFRDYFAKKLGTVKANIAFGFFHYAAYYQNLLAIIFSIGLGLILSVIRKKFTPVTNAANIGVHWGYNSFRLGLFTGGG